MSRRVERHLLAAAMLLASLAACAAPGPADANLVVTRDQLGDDWPLTVSSGVIGCDRDSRRVTINVEGTTYSLNGTAAGGAGPYGDLSTIWAVDPTDHTKNRDLGPLIRLAGNRCGF